MSVPDPPPQKRPSLTTTGGPVGLNLLVCASQMISQNESGAAARLAIEEAEKSNHPATAEDIDGTRHVTNLVGAVHGRHLIYLPPKKWTGLSCFWLHLDPTEISDRGVAPGSIVRLGGTPSASVLRRTFATRNCSRITREPDCFKH